MFGCTLMPEGGGLPSRYLGGASGGREGRGARFGVDFPIGTAFRSPPGFAGRGGERGVDRRDGESWRTKFAGPGFQPGPANTQP